MTSQEVRTIDIVNMEAGNLHPSTSDPRTTELPQVSRRHGRSYMWPILLSTGGILANGISLSTNIVDFSSRHSSSSPSPVPLYIALAFNTASIFLHVIEGVVSCVQQPKRALEENVAAAGKIGDDVEKQLQALQQQLIAATELNRSQELRVKEEQAATQAAREAVDLRISEIKELTLKLEAVNRGLSDANRLAESWRQATEQLTKQVALLEEPQLGEGVEALSAQLQQLSLTKQSFSEGVHALGEGTSAIQETEEVFGKMVDELQRAFEGLAVIAAQKSKLLEEADIRNQSLRERVEELREVECRFAEITPKYEQLLRDFTEAKRQLSELVPLMQSEPFQDFLAAFAAQKKQK